MLKVEDKREQNGAEIYIRLVWIFIRRCRREIRKRTGSLALLIFWQLCILYISCILWIFVCIFIACYAYIYAYISSNGRDGLEFNALALLGEMGPITASRKCTLDDNLWLDTDFSLNNCSNPLFLKIIYRERERVAQNCNTWIYRIQNKIDLEVGPVVSHKAPENW